MRPGRIFTWWALTSFTGNARSSRTNQTGFQYDPVASIATSVTPSAANQSAIASNEPVNEENVRVCFRRPRPPGLGVRTQATTSSLPMSIPAQHSISTSTSNLLDFHVPSSGRDRQGQPINDAVEACTRTTVRGAGKAPGVSLLDGFTRTKRERAQPTPTRFSSFEAAHHSGHGIS